MVSYTRKKTNASTSRPLNAPNDIKVTTDLNDLPNGMKILGLHQPVKEIQDRWRIDDEWWREKPISRMYYKCLLKNFAVVILFQDLITKEWYKQSA